MAVIQQIWLYEIIGSTLPMCQNTTMRVNRAWIKIYCALCSKTYNTLHSCHNFPDGSQQAARGARICEMSLLLCSSWHFRDDYDFCHDVYRLEIMNSSINYNDIIISAMASQISSLTIAYSIFFRRRSKKPSKLSVTVLCEGNSPVTGEFLV